VANKYDIL
jgi:hypothetical protein